MNTKPSEIMLPPSEKRSSLTWSLDNPELEEVLDCAWLELKPDSEDIMGNIEMIPSLAIRCFHTETRIVSNSLAGDMISNTNRH